LSKTREFSFSALFSVSSLCLFQADIGSLTPSTLTVARIASHNLTIASSAGMLGKTILAQPSEGQQAIVH
jgi:hypothetical protein